MSAKRRNRRKKNDAKGGEVGQAEKEAQLQKEKEEDDKLILEEFGKMEKTQELMRTWRKMGLDMTMSELVVRLRTLYDDIDSAMNADPTAEDSAEAQTEIAEEENEVVLTDEERDLEEERLMRMARVYELLRELAITVGDIVEKVKKQRSFAKAEIEAEKAAAELIEEEEAEKGPPKPSKRARRRRGTTGKGQEEGKVEEKKEGGKGSTEQTPSNIIEEKIQEEEEKVEGKEEEEEDELKEAGQEKNGKEEKEDEGEEEKEDDEGDWTAVGSSNTATKSDPKILPRENLSIGLIVFAPHSHQSDEESFEKERAFTVRHPELDYVYGKYRRWIIIGLYSDHILALPCYTFGGRGLKAKRTGKDEFVSLFDHRRGTLEQQLSTKQGEHKPLITKYMGRIIQPVHRLSIIHICEPTSFPYRTMITVQGQLEDRSTIELFELYKKYMPYKEMTAPRLPGPGGAWRGSSRSRPDLLSTMLRGALDRGTFGNSRPPRGPAPRGADGRWIRGSQGHFPSTAQLPIVPEMLRRVFGGDEKTDEAVREDHEEKDKPTEATSNIALPNPDVKSPLYAGWQVSEDPQSDGESLAFPESSFIEPKPMATVKEVERLCAMTHIVGKGPLEDPVSRSPSLSRPSSPEVGKKSHKRPISTPISMSHLSMEDKVCHNFGIRMAKIFRTQAKLNWKKALRSYKRYPSEARFDVLDATEELCEFYTDKSERMLQRVQERLAGVILPVEGKRSADELLFYPEWESL